MIPIEQVDRALVITAHPDDVDFGAAGTVARLTDAGAHVSYCLVTDGQAGGFDHSISRTDMAAMRRVEQTDAGSVVGVADLAFLGWMDGEVESTLELRHQLTRVIRQVRPRVVMAPSPELNLDRIHTSHPDHLAVGVAALAAVYPDARNPFAFPELLTSGLEPWHVDEVWLMAHPGATDVVDITDQVDRKIGALRSHRSQLPDPDTMEANIRRLFRAVADAAGLPEGHSAELFRVVDTR